MKLYPITNGTPDNSLEFVADGSIGEEDDARLYFEDEMCCSNCRHVKMSRTELSGFRVTVFGPAFERLVELAGPFTYEYAAPDGRPGTRTAHRPRSARELCDWLEAELDKVPA